ncbi:hypothetical protein LTS18_003115 [Coniosporium uncinatum]|uniref:Uncharacterized protein n=1 Tax=Coniosporium uncinatum TaxID=93489 RepID=A0ACC3D774_9PEZI|nr:hypothetical protein LTS18_003115 [Coniosporium uncinatum]
MAKSKATGGNDGGDGGDGRRSARHGQGGGRGGGSGRSGENGEWQQMMGTGMWQQGGYGYMQPPPMMPAYPPPMVPMFPYQAPMPTGYVPPFQQPTFGQQVGMGGRLDSGRNRKRDVLAPKTTGGRVEKQGELEQKRKDQARRAAEMAARQCVTCEELGHGFKQCKNTCVHCKTKSHPKRACTLNDDSIKLKYAVVVSKRGKTETVESDASRSVMPKAEPYTEAVQASTGASTAGTMLSAREQELLSTVARLESENAQLQANFDELYGRARARIAELEASQASVKVKIEEPEET